MKMLTKINRVILVMGVFALVSTFYTIGATKKQTQEPQIFPQYGKIEKIDDKFGEIFKPAAVVEKVSEGFISAQACLWTKDSVLVSDTGSNIIYSWNEKKGLNTFQRLRVYSTGLKQLYGPAGLTIDQSGKLVVCHHGDRRILRKESQNHFVSIAEYFNWCRFNGPYGIVRKSNGDIYFTDPPFDSIEHCDTVPSKELIFNGIYRITKNGFIDLLSSKLNSPMGLAFSPDEKFLYVLNQSEGKYEVERFPVKKDDTLEKPEMFFDLTGVIKEKKGQLGGVAVDKQGNLYAATPIGIVVVSKEGKHIGSILTDTPATSCAIGDNGKTIFITTRNTLCRVRL